MARRDVDPQPCTYAPCDRHEWANGLCPGHQRQLDRGKALSPLIAKRAPVQWARLTPADALATALALTTLNPIEGCRYWPPPRHPADRGYCRITLEGRRVMAHRFVFELATGPIPEGFTIDHECHNRAAAAGTCAGGNTCRHRPCVEPTHLSAKTMGDNSLSSPLHRTFGRLLPIAR